MKSRFAFKTAALAIMLAALQPRAACACAICYGDPDSPMTEGLTWGILALVLVVGCVLTGIVTFFVHANRNATNRLPTAPPSEMPAKDN